jgi:YggT family protein
MPTVADTLSRLVGFAADVLYVLILARIVVSWLNLNPWNPLVRWLRRIVDPILRPFRRILPSFAGIDFSPLLAILVIFFVAHLIQSLIASTAGGGVNVAADVLGLVHDVITNIILVLGVLVLIRLLLSLFHADPWHPLVQGVRAITGPLVAPFTSLRRRALRSGIDYPAIATLVAYAVLYVVVEVIFRQLPRNS